PADGERLPPVSREFAEQMSPSALQAIKQISKLRDAQYLSGRGRDKPSTSDEEQEQVLPMGPTPELAPAAGDYESSDG
ncbi:unnamed protein product, partial [Ectocarpus sp. 12 AP-2014]